MIINGKKADLSINGKTSVGVVPKPVFMNPIMSFAEAEQAMRCVFAQVLGDSYRWLPEYDAVCRWFLQPEGKGLMFMGNCGTGKTILLRYVIPTIIEAVCNRIINYFRADEINVQNYEDLRRMCLFAIDDLGTEGRIAINGYRNDFYAVERIVEKAADNRRCMFLSTNLTANQLLDRYGERTFDRICGNCQIVEFKTKGLR